MTAHTCKQLNPWCYRCDLNLDEMADYYEDMVVDGVRMSDESDAEMWDEKIEYTDPAGVRDDFREFVKKVLQFGADQYAFRMGNLK